MIRVTSESDGDFHPRMMSDRANAFIRDSINAAFVFAGHIDNQARFFKVDLSTDAVTPLGTLGLPYGGETEGWYFDENGKLYVLDGPRLRRIDPFIGNMAVVDEIIIDISESMPGHDLWQPHSSDDGRAHSATVRQITSDGSKYPYVGTVAVKDGQRMFWRAVGTIDESQVARDYIVIKEKIDGSEDNRIIEFASPTNERRITDAGGAIGHSDCWNAAIIGEANLPEPGRCVKVFLPTLERVDLFETWNMGYVSYRAGICLHSGPRHLSLVAQDGSGLNPIIEHGNNEVGPDGKVHYDNRVKANLDPSARVAVLMSNMHGRRDVFLAVI